MRNWSTVAELGGMIVAESHVRKRVILNPDTALLIGLKLMTADAKPSHHEIIGLICDSKCERPCIPCTFKSNAICRAYGQGGSRA